MRLEHDHEHRAIEHVFANWVQPSARSIHRSDATHAHLSGDRAGASTVRVTVSRVWGRYLDRGDTVPPKPTSERKRVNAVADESAAPTEVLITVDDASQRLALSRSKVYELISAGELTPVRIGRSCRLLAREVAEFPYRYIAHERDDQPDSSDFPAA